MIIYTYVNEMEYSMLNLVVALGKTKNIKISNDCCSYLIYN